MDVVYQITKGNSMSKILIEIELRQVYGADKYYPSNDAAKLLATIAGTVTLTASTIRTAKDMGMEVVLVQPYKEI